MTFNQPSRFRHVVRAAVLLAFAFALGNWSSTQASTEAETKQTPVYSIAWDVVAPGGGTSTGSGGSYEIHDTIGQPLTGPSSVDQTELYDGFWTPGTQEAEVLNDLIIIR